MNLSALILPKDLPEYFETIAVLELCDTSIKKTNDKSSNFISRISSIKKDVCAWYPTKK